MIPADSKTGRKPWHREPWPWLLMLAPLTAVVFCSVMMWVAIKYRDPLVTEHAWEDGQKLEAPASISGSAPRVLNARP
jgi:hypothetical protein